MKYLRSLSIVFLFSLVFMMGCSVATQVEPQKTDTIEEPVASSFAQPFSLNDAPYTVLAENLTVPWSIAFAPDGRIFFTERPGTIRTITDHYLDSAPWFSVSVHHQKLVDEGGLLGIAIDPDFENTGFVYIAYTYTSDSGELKNRLSRITEDPVMQRGGEETILIDDIPGDRHHDGGAVKIGPDKKLYWSLGDAGTPSLAQNNQQPNGAILRINPDGSVPDDNPISGSYVYSYGHRNPQGITWTDEGDMYVTEHGPSGVGSNCCRDELNKIIPAGNYGWPDIRGEQTRDGMISPVINSGPIVTWAPAGITYVSAGAWKNSLLFVGLKGQSVYRVILDDDNRIEQYLSGKFGRLRDVQVSADGKQIYILTSNQDGRLIFGGIKKTPDLNDDRIIVFDLP